MAAAGLRGCTLSVRALETIALALPRARDLCTFQQTCVACRDILDRFVIMGPGTRFMRPEDVRARALVTYADQLLWHQRTSMTRDEAASALTAEQKSQTWLKARIGRVSASNIGQAAGVGYKDGVYENEDELLLRLLWNPPFDARVRSFIDYGNAHESLARDLFFQWLRENVEVDEADLLPYEDAIGAVAVREEGLLVTSDYRFPSSTDGIVRIGKKVAYLEIKSPASRHFYSDRGKDIPPGHYAQIVVGMHNQQCRAREHHGLSPEDAAKVCAESFYVVYTPTGLQIQIFPFIPEHRDWLLARAVDFYENCYVPRLILKERGYLTNGQVHPKMGMTPAELVYSNWLH